MPYAASISLANPEDTLRKLRRGLETPGFAFLHILAPCPTGWKSEPADGIELICLAVQVGLFPIQKIFEGRETVINIDSELSDSALAAYFQKQGRFGKGEIEVDRVKESIR